MPPAEGAAPAPPTARPRWELPLLAAIALGAVALRLYRLGELSTAGDEETTGLAALALLDGWPPELPGGLVYVRGLPFTLLESLAVGIFGVSAFSLRLVPVLLAAPRVFGAWWLARAFLPPGLSLAAAAILALAALDIEQSRNARMYSMLASFDLLAVAASIHVARGARRAGSAVACGAIAIATQVIGVAHAVVPWLAAFGRGLPPRRRILLGAIGASMLLCYLLARAHSSESYSVADADPASAASHAAFPPVAEHLAQLGARLAHTPSALAAGLGLAGAALLGALAWRNLPGWQPRAAALAALGAAALASPVFAALFLLGVPPLAGASLASCLRRAWPLAAGVACALAGWLAASLAADGLSRGGLEAAARLLLGLPAPNWYELALSMPLLLSLAAIGAVAASDRGGRSEQPGIWLALIGAALAPALLSGLEARTAALRFQIHALGPLIVLALVGASALAARVRALPRAALAAAAALVALGVRPDLGVAALTRTHGSFESRFHETGVAPDHRGAAEFLRAHAAADEWVAAEDPLQQFFLLGRSEIWLRSLADAQKFLRRDPRDGALRDIYTGSRQVEDLAALRALAAAQGVRGVWLVTSGECEMRPDWYRTPETQRALRRLEPLAWFEGADGLTRVYRLVDGEPVAPPRFGAVAP